MLRRETIATNALLVILASALGLPVALFLLMRGMQLPFLLDMVGLATGFLTFVLCRQGRHELAAASHVYAILVVGLVFAVADPALADFGLAMAVLAPVQAALLAPASVRPQSWVGLLVVTACAAVSWAGLFHWPEAHRPEYTIVAGLGFLAAGLVVAHTATRLSRMFMVYERAQIHAFRHLIEHVQDAVIRFGSNGDLLFASESIEKLLGCQRYELGGTGIVDRIHVLDRPAYLTALSEANVDGRMRTIEIRMRRDDADMPALAPNFVWIEMALSPVRNDGEGGRREVVALLRDVTGRKDQEAEMNRARQAAEDASMAKSRFLAIIGHELRTPLNAIAGFSEMMTSGVGGELSPTHREYAGLIHESGRHLIEVVNMLLDMSRIEAGKFELQTESFAPELLVEPCLRMVDQMARKRHVRLMTEIQHNLPAVIADERACRQILINLLSNAVKFSHEHAVVKVTMKRQGSYLNLSVEDSGIGMGEAELSRLGEPFFQANEGLARRYEGTGLGLSIVKGLVELHEGTMRARSVPGEGTVMTVLLPINGPATKLVETGTVTPLHPEPAAQQMTEWRDERKRAL